MTSLGGEVDIGARKGQTDSGTLEAFLQACHGNTTQRASYVVPILESAEVIDILPKMPGKKQRIRLRPAWLPDD